MDERSCTRQYWLHYPLLLLLLLRIFIARWNRRYLVSARIRRARMALLCRRASHTRTALPPVAKVVSHTGGEHLAAAIFAENISCPAVTRTMVLDVERVSTPSANGLPHRFNRRHR